MRIVATSSHTARVQVGGQSGGFYVFGISGHTVRTAGWRKVDFGNVKLFTNYSGNEVNNYVETLFAKGFLIAEV